MIGEEVVTLGSSYTATFASKDVADGIAVTVTALGLDGAGAGNYSLTQPTGLAANITPKALTVTGITAQNRAYTADTAATLNTGSSTLVGVLAAEDVTLNVSGAQGTFASKDVGTAITVAVSGLALSGTQTSNYSLTQPSTTANITPKALTVTGITAQNRAYTADTAAT